MLIPMFRLRCFEEVVWEEVRAELVQKNVIALLKVTNRVKALFGQFYKAGSDHTSGALEKVASPRTSTYIECVELDRGGR